MVSHMITPYLSKFLSIFYSYLIKSIKLSILRDILKRFFLNKCYLLRAIISQDGCKKVKRLIDCIWYSTVWIPKFVWLIWLILLSTKNRNLLHFISVTSIFITASFYSAPVSSFIFVIESFRLKQGNLEWRTFDSYCYYGTLIRGPPKHNFQEHLSLHYRGVFRTLSNIYDNLFAK